jgi:hypothetical protein
VERRKAALQQNNKRYIPQRFRCSGIGDCDRQMIHEILDWQKKPLADDGLLAIFDAGNREEKQVNLMLAELGFKIKSQQNPIEIKNRAGELIAAGHIDGMIEYNGLDFPYDVKSMNDYTFQKIKTLDDFQDKPLLRKYIRQL